MARRSSRSLPTLALRMILPLLLPFAATAQLFTDPVEPPVIRTGSVELANPFTGGLSAPVVQLADLNGDGATDLAISDRDRILRVYMAVPGAGIPSWTSSPVVLHGISVSSWFQFADIDGDGDQDLFAGGPSAGVLMHENVGSARRMLIDPRSKALLDENGSPVINESVNIPAFADPDGDGDLDFFAGNSAGSIVYYENRGSATSPSYRYVTGTYQGITIVGFGGIVNDGEPYRTLHGSMGIDFGDLDQDGDLDILWGDFFNPSIYLLRNEGTSAAPQFVLADSSFPDANPSFSSGFNVPSMGDIDADGDVDLIVGVASGFRSIRNIYLFTNEDPSSLTFRLVTVDPVGGLDLGSTTRPAVGDVTGDGVPDIVVGEGGGSVRLLRGVYGPDRVPVFHLDPDTLIYLPGAFFLDPAIGDMDGNGTNDILLGDFTGRLRAYRYTTAWEEDLSFPMRGPVYGAAIAPDLADLDGDGDLDIVAGFGNGMLRYYENRGSASAPAWAEVPDYFPGIRVDADAVPSIVDANGDGRVDIMIGSQTDGISLFLATEAGYLPYPYVFAEGSGALNTAPALLARNGSVFLLSGDLKGGLDVFQRSTSPIAPLSGSRIERPYPNPALEAVTIRIVLGASERGHVEVFDLLGRRVLRGDREFQGPGYFSETIDVRSLASGIYHVRIGGERRAVAPIVVVR